MAKYTKQKSGLYRTTVMIGYKPDGKPIKKYLSAPTIKELEQKVFEARNDLSNGLILTESVTFGSYADKWLNIYKASKSIQTRNMYSRVFKYLTGIWQTPIKKVNRMMLQQIINDNAAHPRTCEQILLTVKQIFRSAQDDGITGRSPCVSIELPRHVPKEKRALTDEEKQKLRSAILQPQERLMLLILYGTGCRPAEAYALTKSDFDFSTGTIYINKSVKYDHSTFYGVDVPKTNSSIRSVYVSESICRALKKLVDKIPTENVLGGSAGEIMNKNKYETIFKRILRKAGLKDSGITQYTFRHNFATECYYNEISLKECQRMMGHKSYKMVLEVYSHLDQKKENTRSKMSSMVI